ncbi:class I SAM-dependent methyltransferase [Mizugakiibacter sediminis]|uniref:Methyltransferase type 12 n=2 Tax=Mizugakiibacter sediminis TaxID=1475481 RepID=A0A0U1PC48_9GAMM|nr:methyltransferase domain-containing protein [Mizugakiibacter sediminis]
MNITAFSPRLVPDALGIYRPQRNDAHYSYPDDGHERCMQVEDRSFWFRHRNDCIVASMRRFPPPAGVFLDIGGGNGYVTARLLAEGHQAVLLEPGPVGARNARLARGIPTVICATFEHAGILPASLAASGMFDVIEHIERDAAFLDRVADALQPGGRVYATVPSYAWLWSRADISAGHFRRHTRATLDKLFSARFDILYATYFFTALVFPIWLLRSLPYRLGLGRRDGLMSSEDEHGSGGSWAASLLEKILRPEVRAIAAGRTLPFGASCLVVAQKKSV